MESGPDQAFGSIIGALEDFLGDTLLRGRCDVARIIPALSRKWLFPVRRQAYKPDLPARLAEKSDEPKPTASTCGKLAGGRLEPETTGRQAASHDMYTIFRRISRCCASTSRTQSCVPVPFLQVDFAVVVKVKAC